MQRLPGPIEVDVLDSLKMLCRGLQRIDKSGKNTYAAETTTIFTEKRRCL
jgi:hypothetical protein